MARCEVEILKSKGQFYWRIKSRNGKILCHSEKYKRRGNAKRTAILVAQSLPVYDRTKDA